MSHFSVLVVTPEQPTDDVLTAALAPYHEFECTGVDDEYVKDVDITEEAIERYQESTRLMVRMDDGSLVSAYADCFYRDPTPDELKQIGSIAGTGCGQGMSWTSKDWGDGKGYRPKVHDVPKDREVTVPTQTLESLAEFCEGWYGYTTVAHGDSPNLIDTHKFGYVLLDENGSVARVIKRTNPNAKWDYWRVGGRYTGKLQPVDGVPMQQAETSWEWKYSESPPPAGSDVCRKGNLDIDAMRAAQQRSRIEWIDELCQEANVDRPTLEAALHILDSEHAAWMTLDEPRPRGREYSEWLRSRGHSEDVVSVWGKTFDRPELNGRTIDQWIGDAKPLTAFEILKDGKWHGRGDMGWWASVSDEDEDWENVFDNLLSEIPDDHWLAVVDCHI